MTRKARRSIERKLARRAARNAAAETTTATPDSLIQNSEPEPAANLQPETATSVSTPEPGGLFPRFSSISPARLAANRANAQLSTGPKSQATLAISSQNRTTHGLARHNGAFGLLPTEDADGFEAFKRDLAAEHAPETPTESILVQSMAESHWLSQRAIRLQDTCTCPQTGAVTNEKLFTLYTRYHTTHARAFHKSLNDLLKLRKEKRAAQNGFEAQKRQAEELRIKSERHEMKKDHHYWDVLLKDGKACHQLILKSRQEYLAQKEDPGFEAKYQAELAARGLKEHPGPYAAAVIKAAV